jgi:8-oxo-dGTP diphosphatase
MSSLPERPKVGVGVIVCKDQKVLLGKRKGEHGKGTWGFPGGHLELYEDIFDCAQRETLEEVGITLTNLRLGPYTNDPMPKSGKHYVTLFVIGDYVEGEVRVCEPEVFEEWKWFSWDKLPSPLFVPIENLRKIGFDPYEP